jgi:hypothetical protein
LDSKASDDIPTAIDAAVSQFGFLKRTIARSRLRKIATPPQRLVISYNSSHVNITDERRPTRTIPTDGSSVDWTTPAGEKVKAHSAWEGDRLRLSLSTANGQEVDIFSIDRADDRLNLDVAISSPQLPQPLVYRLVFRRQD